MTDYVVYLTEYERNAAANALADTYRISPKDNQQNAADHAYYALLDAQSLESAQGPPRNPAASGSGEKSLGALESSHDVYCDCHKCDPTPEGDGSMLSPTKPSSSLEDNLEQR